MELAQSPPEVGLHMHATSRNTPDEGEPASGGLNGRFEASARCPIFQDGARSKCKRSPDPEPFRLDREALTGTITRRCSATRADSWQG